MIAVVDYGMGNLHSVHKGFENWGFDVRVTSSPAEIDNAHGVVLPGVGAFRDCMKNLDRLGLIEPLRRSIRSGKPFLGICLGLQVLFSESEEFGRSQGMGVFPGKVTRFSSSMPDPDNPAGPFLKIPHMGWNQVAKTQDVPALEGIEPGSYFYFVHSYYVAPEEPEIAATTTDYGVEFISSVARDNVFACQFHPEKSQKLGLKIIKNFGEWVNGKL
ncbi:MAG: imidazole glycerol phosphate synthase subunit HisH [bacterium]